MTDWRKDPNDIRHLYEADRKHEEKMKHFTIDKMDGTVALKKVMKRGKDLGPVIKKAKIKALTKAKQ